MKCKNLKFNYHPNSMSEFGSYVFKYCFGLKMSIAKDFKLPNETYTQVKEYQDAKIVYKK